MDTYNQRAFPSVACQLPFHSPIVCFQYLVDGANDLEELVVGQVLEGKLALGRVAGVRLAQHGVAVARDHLHNKSNDGQTSNDHELNWLGKNVVNRRVIQSSKIHKQLFQID